MPADTEQGVRFDDALGPGGPRMGPVVDPDLRALVEARPERGDDVGVDGLELHVEGILGAQHGRELGQPPGQRTVGIAPRGRQQGRRRGDQRQTLLGVSRTGRLK